MAGAAVADMFMAVMHAISGMNTLLQKRCGATTFLWRKFHKTYIFFSE